MESEGEEGDGEGGRLSSVMTEGDDGLDSSSISRLRKLLIWPDLNSDGISPFASSLCATGDLGDVDAMAAKRRMIFFFWVWVGKPHQTKAIHFEERNSQYIEKLREGLRG